MNKIYGIAVVCVASDRLIIDEDGKQFYECMTQEELEKIAQEKDKDTLKTYLFNALSMMDSTISAFATNKAKFTDSIKLKSEFNKLYSQCLKEQTKYIKNQEY